MKKYLFLAASAIIALAGCAKVTTAGPDLYSPSNEIAFQKAAYALATKAADGDEFSTSETFGTYAWSAASQLTGNIFMDNETVSYRDNAWKPSKTYYWPKDATVDFFSYAPKSKAPTSVAQDNIKYVDYDLTVAANQVDLLYADKAVGYGNNVNEITTTAEPESGFQGVPTLFRHALSKVTIGAKLAYDRKATKEEDNTYTVTKWVVELKSINCGNVYTKGSLNLNLSDPTATGLVGWNVMDGMSSTADVSATKVWSEVSTKSDTYLGGTGSGALNTTTYQYVVDGNYVMPQTLSDATDGQTIKVGIVIKTYRKTGILDETDALAYRDADIVPGDIFLIEGTDVAPLVYTIKMKKAFTAFEMGKNYTIKLDITPTKGSGVTGGGSGTPDPDDPDLDDVTITFDPAVKGWVNVDLTASLYI